jgi:1,4-dihydroxy-6-naphthoate synthase
MKLTLGFSPCPNDTFIFDALLHGAVDTEGLSFEVVMEDVEALNRLAFAGALAVTKLSYHACAHLTEMYDLCDAGSALGKGCGPLLVARTPLTTAETEQARIAIPGRMTTANFLLGIACPKAQNKQEMLFSDIEDAVVEGRADAGLIIHENRFTYAEKGLVQVADLGACWEESTGLPIPLGAIVMQRRLPEAVKARFQRVLRRSVEYAFAYPEASLPFVRTHAQAMSDVVMQAHIGLYVTNYTVSLGTEGRRAVEVLFDTAVERGLISGYRKGFLPPPDAETEEGWKGPL